MDQPDNDYCSGNQTDIQTTNMAHTHAHAYLYTTFRHRNRTGFVAKEKNVYGEHIHSLYNGPVHGCSILYKMQQLS